MCRDRSRSARYANHSISIYSTGITTRIPQDFFRAFRRVLHVQSEEICHLLVCEVPRRCAPFLAPVRALSPYNCHSVSFLFPVLWKHFPDCTSPCVAKKYPSTTSKFGVYRQNGDIEFSSIDLPYISPRIHRIFSCTVSRTYSRPSTHLGSRNYSQPDQWTRRFYRRLDQWTPRLYHRLARLLSTTLYNSSVARLLSGSCFKPFLLDIAGGRAGVRALLSRNEKTYISPEESLAPAI